MKVTLDRKYIEDYQMDRVKADAKEFGKGYTSQDLYLAFKQAVGWNIICTEIIKCEVEAFDAGWAYGEQTAFKVNMILDDFDKMFKVSFYCDLGLGVNTNTLPDGTKMYRIQEYKLQ